MKKVHINTSRPYDVHIGPGLLKKMKDLLPEKTLAIGAAGGIGVLITDENVNALYGHGVEKEIEELGFQVLRFVVPSGEEAKSGEWYLKALSFLAANHVSRGDVIFALGGGVVGDLSGFLAATFLRGIDFVQLPTTLLSAVDSSVGGKTAINLPEGKNLVGAFYQPVAVIMDTDTLDTLEPSVFADGCAEVLKYGMIWDGTFYEELKEYVLTKPEHRGDVERMTSVIARCVAIKAEVVSQDEKDKGLRNLLNFGHTIGHSIEKNSGFGISHGSAVAMGMVVATRAAEQAGICQAGATENLVNTLQDYGLPVETEYGAEVLKEGMLSDKKIEGAKINLILPRTIGECYIHKMSTNELGTFLLG